MKHIPIMLALALSISLTSYDTNTIPDANNRNITEATSITMNATDNHVLGEELTIKLEDKL